MSELDPAIKDELKRPGHIRAMLEREGAGVPYSGMFCCVLPGHDDKNPSANIQEINGAEYYHCFGCGRHADIFGLYQELHGCDFKTALHDLAALAGLSMPDAAPPAPSAPAKTATAKPALGNKPDTQTAKYIKACAGRLWTEAGKVGLDYLHGRGIFDETAKKCGIGYDPKQGKKGAIIIPYGPRFFKRFLEPITTKTGESMKGIYDAPKGTQRPLYDVDDKFLGADSTGPVYIVEGEIDALSLIEAGQQAIATGGTGGWRKLVELAKQHPARCFIPCFDRDDAGEAAQRKAEAALAEISGCHVFKGAPILLLPDRNGKHAKDCNEALVEDRAGFIERARMIAEMATQKATAETQAATDPEAVFNRELNGVLLRRLRDIPQAKPEAEDPDAIILGYALAKGEGWIIAGEPGVGKSSFLIMLIIFAAAGKPFFGFKFARPLKVLYLQTELQNRKLEQSRNSIIQHLRTAGHWNESEIDLALNNFVYDELMIGNTVDDIESAILKRFEAWPFDLLVLDPLITFAEDDLSLLKPTKELLYGKMTKLMGGRTYKTAGDLPVKFAAIIGHHTSKPRTENGRIVDRGQYNMLGSTALNAWPRFQLNISHFAEQVYKLTAAKNPECAPWRSPDGETFIDTLYIKRAERGERYWIEASADDVAAAELERKQQRKARRDDATGGNVAAAFDEKMAALKFAERLNHEREAMSSSDAAHLARDLFGSHGREVYNLVMKDAESAAANGTAGAYGVHFHKKGYNKFIGGPVQNLTATDDIEQAPLDDSGLDDSGFDYEPN